MHDSAGPATAVAGAAAVQKTNVSDGAQALQEAMRDKKERETTHSAGLKVKFLAKCFEKILGVPKRG